MRSLTHDISIDLTMEEMLDPKRGKVTAEERAFWRAFLDTDAIVLGPRGIVLRLLDDLEEAERQMKRLATMHAEFINCVDIKRYNHCHEDREGCIKCWLEWAAREGKE